MSKRTVIKVIIISAILVLCIALVDNTVAQHYNKEETTSELPKKEVAKSSKSKAMIAQPKQFGKISTLEELPIITPIPVITEQAQEQKEETQEQEEVIAEIPLEEETPEETYIPETETAEEYVEQQEYTETEEVSESIPEEPQENYDEPENEESTDNSGGMEYVGNWEVTFYCSCSQCCGVWANGVTASEAIASPWYTVATGDLPFGTQLYIDGLGYFVVQDRGVPYGYVDIFVNSHDEALANGRQYRDVYIVS